MTLNAPINHQSQRPQIHNENQDIHSMKNNYKFTPGPWRTISDPCHYGTMTDVISDDGSMFVSVGGETDLSAQEANARLIACAPVMFDVLILALQELEANKTAMIGPEWAATRTATGGACCAIARVLYRARGA